ARNVTYRGRETIKKMYLRVFSSAEGMTFQPIERFATPDRVFDVSRAMVSRIARSPSAPR
ncbi:MAG: hypothetical protein WB005_15715, partial [Pseudolabrys sp.]